MKKLLMPISLGVVLITAGCGEHENPEDIFNRSKQVLDDTTESVHFQQWHNLNISGESMNTNSRGAARLQPFELYMISTMDLVDFNEPLEFEFQVDGEEAYVIEDGEVQQFSDQSLESILNMINPIDEMNRYEEFEQSMLMKEIEDFYEVSFRTDQEQHIPLVVRKMEQWGMIDEEIDQAVEDSIEIERIDMVAFIDKETYELHQFDTRYRFTVELQGDLQQVDDQQSTTFDYWNDVSGDLEEFVDWVMEEEQREAEEESDEEDEEEPTL